MNKEIEEIARDFCISIQDAEYMYNTIGYRKERYGEWLISGKCTLCKEYSPIHSKYCPNCGAKMRGKDE